jgi:hypothetical protein
MMVFLLGLVGIVAFVVVIEWIIYKDHGKL